MGRRLFCEISPTTYQISVLKNIVARDVKNVFSRQEFATDKTDSPLPFLIYGNKSLMRRVLGNVDPLLQENKVINLALSAPKVTNVLIRPGQTFSFWKLVGRCSEREGYKKGLVISSGKVAEGIGGGMCQFTNLIHFLVLHSPMEIVEHHHHDAMDLFPDFGRQIPFGTGTSIMYNYLDYRFKNNTDTTFQLITYVTDKYLCGELRANKRLDVRYHIRTKSEYFSREGDTVYRNGLVFREQVDERTGNLLQRELIKKNHAVVMYDVDDRKILRHTKWVLSAAVASTVSNRGLSRCRPFDLLWQLRVTHWLSRSLSADSKSIVPGVASLALTRSQTGPSGLRSLRHLPGVVCVYNGDRYCRCIQGVVVKKLVIAEKPSVAEQLAAVIDHCKKSRDYYEGEHYIVSWAVGHLVGLAEPEDYDKKYKQWLLSYLPIIPEAFGFSVLEGAEERFNALKKLIGSKEVDEVINACDAGREGELIFRNIYVLAGAKKPASRLWLSSYTDESIRDGFKHIRPESEYDDLGRAALARSEADWLVGINATRGLTRRNGSLVTVGRVQTPVLALIAKREKEVQAFTPVPYFEVEGEFRVVPNGEPTYAGLWHRGSESRLADQKMAEVIATKCSGRKGVVASVAQKESRMQVPYLYDLGLLQREANGLNGLSASRTLRAAQSLYEEKRAITYPRTDSKYLPKALRKEVITVLGDLGIGEYAPYVQHVQREGWKMRPFVFNDEKVSDHYAIIPTGTRLDRSTLSHDESVVYDLVVRRFLEQFYPEAVLMLTRVETLVEGETFGSDGRVVKTSGWLEVAPREADSKDLPDLREKLSVQAFRVESEHKLTKAPPRFTDASIIAAMETAGKLVDDEELAEAMKERGLGTPATRAEIIEKLIRTGVVERKARSLVATRRGVDLIDLLEAIQLADLVAPDLTGDWEMSLRRIEKGSLDNIEFLRRIEAFTRQMIEKIKGYEAPTQIGIESAEPLGVCPICGGNVLERPASYVCEHHGRKKTDCKFSIPKMILRRSINREEALQLMTEKRTDMLDGFVSRRGFKFSARLLLKPDNKLEWEFAEGSGGSSAATEPVVNEEPLGRCPVCQGSVVETTEHYRCTGEDCRFQMKRVYAGKTIDREMARNLLEKGKTDLIEDFVSKYNRPFSAYLKLGDKGRVEFEFLNKGPRTGSRTGGRTTKTRVPTTKATKAEASTTKTKKTKSSTVKVTPKTSKGKGGAS